MKPPSSSLLRYGIAVAATGISTLLTLCLRSFLDRGTMVLYIPAVMVGAWYGGLGPGLLSTFLGVGITAYFFLNPKMSFTIQSADDLAQLAVFSLVAFFISLMHTAQKRAQQALLDSTEKIRLVSDVTRAANEAETVDHAFRFALQRLCEGGPWFHAHAGLVDKRDETLWIPSAYNYTAAEDRFLPLRSKPPLPSLRKGEGLAGRSIASGRVEWVEDLSQDPSAGAYRSLLEAGARTAVAFPVKIGRETPGVFESFSLQRVEKSEAVVHLMEVVGLELGRVLERQRLQEDYSEAVWQQQRVIAQELHDGLGQQLTGLGFMSQSLSEKLKDPEEARRAERLTAGLKTAMEQIRGLARGVTPVAPDAEGLMSALRNLAETTAAAYGLECRFDCPEPVPVEDNEVAVHLFRIAQEAVTNAAKHGRPSRISILLRTGPEGLRLSVTDDGKGFSRTGGVHKGSGLSIMRYRAAAIGAVLRIEDAPEHGTRVGCVLADRAAWRTPGEVRP
jgi:signal transduction histidine kinase